MAIQSPEPNIPLDEATQKSIEQGKNQVTLLQSETNRLVRLKSQLEKEIGNLNSEKVILTESVSNLKEQSSKLISDNQRMSDNLLNSQNELKSIKVEQSIVIREITSQKADLSVISDKIKADREQLTQDQTVLRLDKELHESNKKEFEAKKKLLKDVLNKI